MFNNIIKGFLVFTVVACHCVYGEVAAVVDVPQTTQSAHGTTDNTTKPFISNLTENIVKNDETPSAAAPNATLLDETSVADGSVPSAGVSEQEAMAMLEKLGIVIDENDQENSTQSIPQQTVSKTVSEFEAPVTTKTSSRTFPELGAAVTSTPVPSSMEEEVTVAGLLDDEKSTTTVSSTVISVPATSGIVAESNQTLNVSEERSGVGVVDSSLEDEISAAESLDSYDEGKTTASTALQSKQNTNISEGQGEALTSDVTAMSSVEETGRVLVTTVPDESQQNKVTKSDIPDLVDVNSNFETSTPGPGGNLVDFSTMTQRDQLNSEKTINDGIIPIKNSPHLHYQTHISIFTGLILAVVGVAVMLGVFMVWKRKRTQIKRKLMMNFDLKRLDLWHLHQPPTNVLVVDFPKKHEDETWHDVKPVTSSVV